VELSPRSEIYFFIVGVHDLTPRGREEEDCNSDDITQLVNIAEIQPQARRFLPYANIGQLDGNRKDRGLAVLVAIVGAIVFLEGILREAVERERGTGAFETWGRDAPGAMGTAPAGEVVPFDPDQAFTHTTPAFFACVGIGDRAATGGTHQENERGRVDSCPSPETIFHEIAGGQSD
jgi:hypothetical protein